MSDGITCYERDEELCVDPMCLRTGCRLRNERLAALAQPQNDAEAVAWRFRYELKEGSWGKWTVQRNDPNWFEPTMTDVQVEPLFTAPPSPELTPWRDELSEIIGHLGAAITQSIAGDDQIIMDHIKAAHEIAKIVRRKA